MKVFVTGVAGQLGHDVMNELSKRGYEGIGSDIAPEYSGVQDGSAVTIMPYVSLDITDKEAVEKVLTEQKPDVVVHCAVLWSSIFVTLMANKIGGLQFGIYRNCQISSRVFHTAVAALPLTKANRSDFE